MRIPFARGLIITLLAAGLLSCGPSVTNRPAGKHGGELKATAIEMEIHRLINIERSRKKLKALKFDPALADIARLHSRDMIRRGYFSHESPDGMNFSERYEQAGYECRVPLGQNSFSLGAENIFTVMFNGPHTEEQIAEETVKGWMQSMGHRKNIMTPHWGREGIGVFIGREGGMVVVKVTQNFC